MGAYVLGQLGAVTLAADGQTVVVLRDERPFRAPTVTLLDLAVTETVSALQEAIATALGHLADPGAVETLGRWRTRPQVTGQWTVALALTGLPCTDDDALRRLVEVTADPDWWCHWSCASYTKPAGTPRRSITPPRSDRRGHAGDGAAGAGWPRPTGDRAAPEGRG